VWFDFATATPARESTGKAGLKIKPTLNTPEDNSTPAKVPTAGGWEFVMVTNS
jgi:hypothetical protein